MLEEFLSSLMCVSHIHRDSRVHHEEPYAAIWDGV